MTLAAELCVLRQSKSQLLQELCVREAQVMAKEGQLMQACDHEWRTCRDPGEGMYSERCTYCLRCGRDKSSEVIIHPEVSHMPAHI